MEVEVNRLIFFSAFPLVRQRIIVLNKLRTTPFWQRRTQTFVELDIMKSTPMMNDLSLAKCSHKFIQTHIREENPLSLYMEGKYLPLASPVTNEFINEGIDEC